MIEPGLSRVSRLVNPSSFSWKAIHVAGTNGKGSVCAYVSVMLAAGGIRCGRFTSPHLIDRWDCITIGERTIPQPLFSAVEERVKRHDACNKIGATEFELLTATAFEIFNQEKVDVGVVEVGMGGRLDATNVLEDKLVTVITKIGLDHEAFLGKTVQEVALHKAGIMRRGVDCVIDGTNSPEVLKVLEAYADEVGASSMIVLPDFRRQKGLASPTFTILDSLEPHQQSNLACAMKALDLVMKHLHRDLDVSTLINVGLKSYWPGRLEQVNLSAIVPRAQPVLLDGAHNAQSAEVLRAYVSRHVRNVGQPVTWVFAASKGKNLRDLFSILVQDRDSVATVKFGPVDGMPWVEPADSSEIVTALFDKKELQVHDSGLDLEDGLAWATRASAGGPLVVAGSLYLVTDMHRLLRSRSIE